MENRDILLGEFKEFKKVMTHEVQMIRKDIRTLLEAKWRLAGVTSVVMIVVEITIHVVAKVARG